ncbi:MAG: GerMN domain-containing protein [Thermoanaerobaculales bacterium]|nr:GerMN domain-containing protein [Thermoanaerobaculales bacterium]
MNWRVALIALAAVAAVALLAWLLQGGKPQVERVEVLDVVELPTPTPAPEQRVILLFAGRDGMLHPELRSVPLPEEVHERIRIVMDELLAGPKSATRLSPPVPYQASLQAVFVDQHGNAYVDLTAPPQPLTGSSTELMLAYGVINSIILNCPEVSAVQILFGGHEVDTLTGHLDLSRPLVLNKRFIASS